MFNEPFPKRCFTELEAAEYMSISINYLRRARSGQPLPSDIQAPSVTYINGRIRYLKEDLDAWLDRMKIESIRS